MKKFKKYSVVIVILLLVIIGGLMFRKSLMAKQYTVPLNQNSPSSMTLFSSSPDYQYAVQIFPGQLSDKAKMYLGNFDMSTQAQSDGSTIVTLTAKGGNGSVQKYTVKSDQVLYFVEKFPGDDKADNDMNIKDDYGVIVDVNGYIVLM